MNPSKGAYKPRLRADSQLAACITGATCRGKILDGGCGPRLNQPRDPSYWFSKGGAPWPKLDNEKPKGETVDYAVDGATSSVTPVSIVWWPLVRRLHLPDCPILDHVRRCALILSWSIPKPNQTIPNRNES